MPRLNFLNTQLLTLAQIIMTVFVGIAEFERDLIREQMSADQKMWAPRLLNKVNQSKK